MFPLQNKEFGRQRCNEKEEDDVLSLLYFSTFSGRYMVALRDIAALETILEERAAASGPKLCHAAVCVECLASVDTSALYVSCASCGLPFCSERCRAARACHTARECALFSRCQRRLGREDLEEESGVLASVTAVRLLALKEENLTVWERANILMDNMDRIR